MCVTAGARFCTHVGTLMRRVAHAIIIRSFLLLAIILDALSLSLRPDDDGLAFANLGILHASLGVSLYAFFVLFVYTHTCPRSVKEHISRAEQ